MIISWRIMSLQCAYCETHNKIWLSITYKSTIPYLLLNVRIKVIVTSKFYLQPCEWMIAKLYIFVIYLHKCFNFTTPKTCSWLIRPSSKSASYFSMNIDLRYSNRYGCNKEEIISYTNIHFNICERFSPFFIAEKRGILLVMIFDLGDVLLILCAKKKENETAKKKVEVL